MTSRPPVLFQLYTAYQRVGRLVSEALAGSGIPPEDAPLYNVLGRLGPMRPTELARALGMAPSTITYRMQALEARGHLVRKPDPQDGRSTLLRLSEEGVAAWARVLPQLVARLRAAEDRLAVPQPDVGRALDALSEAVEAELASHATRA
jgi:DNA-binding MarR family transcriptional regulator